MIEQVKTRAQRFADTRFAKFVAELYQEWKQDNVSTLASSLAYYATFSIVPMLMITIAIGGMVFGEETTRQELLTQLQLWIGDTGAEFIERALEADGAGHPKSGLVATLVSLGVLVVGATRFLSELQASLNRVWEVAPTRRAFWDSVRKRILSFGIIALAGALMLSSFLLSAVLAVIARYTTGLIPGGVGLWEALNTATYMGLGSALFAVLFKYFPDAEVQWKDVWVGAILTTALLYLGKLGMGFYVGRSAFSSTYGAAGSLIVFLLWVYVSAQIVLIGAEFTQVWARHRGREIEPHENARRVYNGV